MDFPLRNFKRLRVASEEPIGIIPIVNEAKSSSTALLNTTVYREIIVDIKFGEKARNCLDKYLVNLKFGDSHSQIESYDVEHIATLVGPFSAAYLLIIYTLFLG